MSKDDVAALVERLERLVILDEVGSNNSLGRDVASAIKAQAAKIERLTMLLKASEGLELLALRQRDKARADKEAAEAKLSEARADGMREAARIAAGIGNRPHSIGVATYLEGVSAGAKDAAQAILAAIGETRDE